MVRGQHRKRSYVKLTSINQQRFVYVKLHDERPTPVEVVTDQVLDSEYVVRNLDATPTIRVFTWFDNPNVGLMLSLHFMVNLAEPI